LLVGAAIIYIRKLLSRVRGIDPLSAFTVYLAATLILGVVAFYLGRLIDPLLSGILMALPESIAMQLVYILAVIVAALFAAEISFLFGLPVLTWARTTSASPRWVSPSSLKSSLITPTPCWALKR